MATSALNIQYGAGWTAANGWLNFDASPSVRIERLPIVGKFARVNKERFPEAIVYGDIVRGLPVPPGQAKAVFASHVLEHLSLEDFHVALRNTLIVMRPGGVFRLIVPDLAERSRRYLKALDANDPEASVRFCKDTLLGRETRPKGLKGSVRAAMGNSEHLWMWDELSMTQAMRDSGFADVRRCEMGDSTDPDFAVVERHDRFFDEGLGIAELAMEGRRPAI